MDDNSDASRIERGYKALFDAAPVGIIEQDCSAVKGRLDELFASGIDDLEAYFRAHPDELIACISLIRVVDVNETAVAMLRAPSKEVLKQAITQRVTSEPVELMIEVALALAKGRLARSREHTTLRFDGTPLTVAVTTTVVAGFEESYGRILTSMTDVSALREAEQLLAHSEAKFRAMTDASPAGIFFYDTEANIEYVNEAGVALTGLPREEVMGRGWERSLHPDDRERIFSALEASLTAGKGYSGSGRFLHPDGRVVWWEARAAEVTLDGVKRGFVSVLQDLSEQKAIEAALRESQTLLRGVMDSSPAAITVKGTTGEFLFANRQAAQGLGLAPDEILGRTLRDVLPLDAAIDNERKDAEVMSSGQPSRIDEAYIRDGERITLNVLRFPILDASGAPSALCVVSTDISERLEAEETRRRDRQQLAIDIHDDSVQVMASVALQLDTAAKTASSEAERERLATLVTAVRDAVGRLRTLMFDLGSSALEDEDLATLLEQMLEHLQRHHQIAYRLDVAVPPVALSLRSMFVRIAREALSNVVKHSDASLVTVEVRERDGGVELSVTDNGRGFDPTMGSVAGHLGLPSIRSQVASAAGHTEITSAPEAGTTIRAWVPLGLRSARVS